jgi:hypothetical protein
LASSFITNELFGSLMGAGSRGQASEGATFSGIASGLLDLGIGLTGDKPPATSGSSFSGIAGSLLNLGIGLFSDGGEVKPIPTGDLRYADNPIGRALRWEGPNSTLAALTPRERVLTVEENQYYEHMFPRGIANFRTGGVVGGATSNQSFNFSGAGTNVNIPINISGNSDTKIDAGRLEAEIKNVVLTHMNDQNRPRGIVYRG